MSRRADRARAGRINSGRHSNTMAGGRGDPRDHRKADQGLTDHDLDEEHFEISQGKLTLKLDATALAGMLEPLVGSGLLLSGGKLSVNIGATIGLDQQGRLAVEFVGIDELVDNTAGTPGGTLAAIPDPADAPGTPDALRDDLVANTLPPIRDALASLSERLNAILTTATTSARP